MATRDTLTLVCSQQSDAASRLEKFRVEIFETKERSKVLSALKRRGKSDEIARKLQAPATFTADVVIRSGILTKQGSWRRNWKTVGLTLVLPLAAAKCSCCLCPQRFFILRSDFPSLCYYPAEDRLELLGEIPFTGDTLVLDKSMSGRGPFRIQIRTGAKSLLLEADSRSNQHRWIDACQSLVDSVRADRFRTSPARPLAPNAMAGAALRSPARRLDDGTTRASITERLIRASSTSDSDKENNSDAHSSSYARSDSKDESSIDISAIGEASYCSSWNDEDESDAESDDVSNQTEQLLSNSGVVFDSAERVSQTADSELSVSKHRLYDVSIEVLLGRMNRLMRLADANNSERTGIFVKLSAYSRREKAFVEIGTTDIIKVSSVLAAANAAGTSTPGSNATSSSVRVFFSVLLTCELGKYDQLGLALYKCSLNQAPGTAQSCVGIGRCAVSDELLRSQRSIVTITEKSSSRDPALNASASAGPPRAIPMPLVRNTSGQAVAGGGSVPDLNSSSQGSVQLVIQAFRGLTPQQVLSTTGIDMAATKYLIPTTLSPSGDPTAASLPPQALSRSALNRTLVNNGSFVGSNSGPQVGSNVRYLAMDEILRVPRSTYALPLAYLDFLEEETLKKTRYLVKQTASHENALNDFELEYYRKKLPEYIKQRQFLMKQEKRLLAEQLDNQVGNAAKNYKRHLSNAADRNAPGQEIDAPFKRSTFKSEEAWQYLPTNMQDQFMCVHQNPPRHPSRLMRLQSARMGQSPAFVWHTMTMGCPAAHTKGFANGGFSHTDAVATPAAAAVARFAVTNNNPAYLLEDEAHPNETITSPVARSSSSSVSPRHKENAQRRSSLSALKQKKTVATHPVEDSMSSLTRRLEMTDRMDIISSQILSAAVACLLASLDLALLGSDYHLLQLENAVHVGYLVHFESLLSTQGKEIGMLEDFAAGAKWLRNVFIQFRKHQTSGDNFVVKRYSPPTSADQRRTGSLYTDDTDTYDTDENDDWDPMASTTKGSRASCLLVTIGLNERHMNILPPVLVGGKPFRVRCVLFTQGVNEKQSLVHAYKSGSVKVQNAINRESLAELRRIYMMFRRLHENDVVSGDRRQPARRRTSSVGADPCITRFSMQALDALFKQIERHVSSTTHQFKKNVALLMDASDFCRELGGARVTCCKSGKDRTAMSVTLEQARICCSELKATQGTRLVAMMRLYGVRRRNVFMNTRSNKFAFNEMQRRLLPDCYKPPLGTYKSGKT